MRECRNAPRIVMEGKIKGFNRYLGGVGIRFTVIGKKWKRKRYLSGKEGKKCRRGSDVFFDQEGGR